MPKKSKKQIQRPILDCMFSGESTDNDEHVIPRWLQSRFDLWSQTVFVPNGTDVKYRYLRVPVKSTHNTAFGKIENNISKGIFDPQEVFLWALKIHVGFIYRDGSLKVDRADPASGTIINIDDFATEVKLFRKLYDVWAKGGKIYPNPFGTVHVMDALTPQPRFDFAHCYMSSSVFIQIGTKVVYVSLWDQSDGLHANLLKPWWEYHKPFVESTSPDKRDDVAYVAQHVWACETSYWLWRQRRRLNFIMTDDSFNLIPPVTRPPGRPADEQELSMFCRSFGLRLRKYNGEVGNVFESVSHPRDP